MPCPAICPREQVSRDDASPGPVGSDEMICRGVFPSDRTSSGVKKSAIRAGHLWSGELSVWRVSERAGLDINGLVAVLDPLMVRADGEKFDQLRGTPAISIRNFSVGEVPLRACSLLDECTMDNAGTKHRAHAHIAICRELRSIIQKGDDTFLAIQEGLKLLFEPTVWQRQ
jgi:hypothetical protein